MRIGSTLTAFSTIPYAAFDVPDTRSLMADNMSSMTDVKTPSRFGALCKPRLHVSAICTLIVYLPTFCTFMQHAAWRPAGSWRIT
jgi:hypothetical protein